MKIINLVYRFGLFEFVLFVWFFQEQRQLANGILQVGDSDPQISVFPKNHFFFGASLCERALAAAAFDSLLVRPSVKTLEAADAAGPDVLFFGAAVWLKALAAAVLDLGEVTLLVRVLDALLAAFAPVTFGATFLYSHCIKIFHPMHVY